MTHIKHLVLESFFMIFMPVLSMWRLVPSHHFRWPVSGEVRRGTLSGPESGLLTNAWK